MQKETVSYHEDDSTGLTRAACIERHEREPMDFERLKFLCWFVAGMTAMILGFVALYMVIYFAGR